MLNRIVALLAIAVLGACALPRGAPVEREVLALHSSDKAEFALYPVKRETLRGLANWPVTNNVRSFGWVGQQAAPESTRIRPFDRLHIVIWDSEENSLLTAPTQKLVDVPDLRVSESGQVFVPYIGYLRVADRTPDQARNQIEREMVAIVPSAQVQLSVTPGTKGSVSLVGGVKTPATIPLPEGKFTVLNLVSVGGGPEQLRNPQVRLIRGGRTYGTSLEGLYENPSRDVALRGGDKIALVDDDRFFRSFGATESEDIVYFTEDKITALDSISLIGGLSDYSANPQGMLVLREYPASAVRSDGRGPKHQRTIFALDLTSADGLFSANKFQVYSGDTVMVTESPVNSARTVFGLAGTLIGFNTQFSR